MRGLLIAAAGSVASCIPFVHVARRVPVRARALALGRVDQPSPGSRGPRGVAPGHRLPAGALARAQGWAARVALPGRERRRRAAVAREVPACCDLLRVALCAGASPHRALELAARWGPPQVGMELVRTVAEAGTGAGIRAALARLAEHPVPELAALARTLGDAVRLGAPVADALGRQAGAQRARLRRRAEAHARTAAVRLLFPLVGMILPAFGLLTVVPTLLGTLRYR